MDPAWTNNESLTTTPGIRARVKKSLPCPIVGGRSLAESGLNRIAVDALGSALSDVGI
jgi:hypothetical protein